MQLGSDGTPRKGTSIARQTWSAKAGLVQLCVESQTRQVEAAEVVVARCRSTVPGAAMLPLTTARRRCCRSTGTALDP